MFTKPSASEQPSSTEPQARQRTRHPIHDHIADWSISLIRCGITLVFLVAAAAVTIAAIRGELPGAELISALLAALGQLGVHRL